MGRWVLAKAEPCSPVLLWIRCFSEFVGGTSDPWCRASVSDGACPIAPDVPVRERGGSHLRHLVLPGVLYECRKSQMWPPSSVVSGAETPLLGRPTLPGCARGAAESIPCLLGRSARSTASPDLALQLLNQPVQLSGRHGEELLDRCRRPVQQ